MTTFDSNKPFQTKCGWPARKLGVLNRTAFPLVVAVHNPAFNAEELHAYPMDGSRPTKLTAATDQFIGKTDLGAENGALSLVNI